MIWAPIAAIGAFLKRLPWQVWAIAAILVTSWVWGEIQHDRGYDKRTAEYEAAQRKEEARARKDDAKAAQRREENRIKNEGKDNARQEAIDNAPDDTTDAAGRALACERLRQAGLDTPAACG